MKTSIRVLRLVAAAGIAVGLVLVLYLGLRLWEWWTFWHRVPVWVTVVLSIGLFLLFNVGCGFLIRRSVKAGSNEATCQKKEGSNGDE